MRMVEADSALLILRIVVPMLYALVSAGYITSFAGNKPGLSRWTKIAFAFAVAFHGLTLVLIGYARSRFPFGTVFEGIFFCSLLISVLYVALERVEREVHYGAFLFPVNLVVATFALIFLGHGESLPGSLLSPYFVLHVSMTLLAYACFLLSFIVSIMYILQYRAIRGRRLGGFHKRLPALAVMDESVTRADALGLAFLFLGMVLGFVWLDMVVGAPFRMNLKIGFTCLTIIVYLAEHLLRIGKGWRGERMCFISMVGFVFVLITLAIGRHGY